MWQYKYLICYVFAQLISFSAIILIPNKKKTFDTLICLCKANTATVNWTSNKQTCSISSGFGWLFKIHPTDHDEDEDIWRPHSHSTNDEWRMEENSNKTTPRKMMMYYYYDYWYIIRHFALALTLLFLFHLLWLVIGLLYSFFLLNHHHRSVTTCVSEYISYNVCVCTRLIDWFCFSFLYVSNTFSTHSKLIC